MPRTKKTGRKQKSRLSRPDNQRASSGNNIPTIELSPKRHYTVVMDNHTGELPHFSGTITYLGIKSALEKQIATHLVQQLGFEDQASGPWQTIQLDWVKAWGEPYNPATEGAASSQTNFALDIEPGQGGSRSPPPVKVDYPSGASDRPYAMVRGSPNHWANSGNDALKAISCRGVEIVHFGVTVW